MRLNFGTGAVLWGLYMCDTMRSMTYNWAMGKIDQLLRSTDDEL